MSRRARVTATKALAALLILSLCPGCPREAPPGADGPDPDTAAPVVQVDGVVRALRIHPLRGQNLTRDEARITVRVLRAGVDVTEMAWLELQTHDTGPDAPPVATGQGGEEIALAPGQYRIQLQLRESDTAVGRGTAGVLTLAPATALRATLEVAFATGTLTSKVTNRGTSIDDESRILVRPAEGGEPIAEARAGRALRLPAGDYTVSVIWRGGSSGSERMKTLPTRVEPDTTTTVTHDFDLALVAFRVQVRDESGRDLTEDTTLELKPKAAGEPTASGGAAFEYTASPGKYTLSVEYREPPFLVVRRTLDELSLRPSTPMPLDVELPLNAGRLSFEVMVRGRPGQQCSVRIGKAGAERRVQATSLTGIHLPAGTEWDAEIRCGEHARVLTGLRVRAGEHLRRRVAL